MGRRRDRVGMILSTPPRGISSWLGVSGHKSQGSLSEPTASTSSTLADPLPIAAFSKAVVRTVITFTASFGEDLIFSIAFPA